MSLHGDLSQVMKEGGITRFELDPDNLPGMSREEVARLEAMTEEEIYAAALSDPDAQPLTEEQLAHMHRKVDPVPVSNFLEGAMSEQEQISRPRIFADFHNADSRGRLRLNCIGTVEDLSRQQIALRDSLPVILYSEDIEVDGLIRYSEEESLWVTRIDWDAIRPKRSPRGPWWPKSPSRRVRGDGV